MPLPTPDCGATGDPCCHSLFMVAEHLLAVVLPGQIECILDSGCGESDLRAFVVHGLDFDDPICDSLIVFLTDISPSPGSTTATGAQLLSAVYRATYKIRLREAGYPMATDDGETIYAPDPEHVHLASRHSYGHGERLMRDVVNAQMSKSLVPKSCAVQRVSRFTPLLTSGGCAGWEVEIEVDVPWSLKPQEA